MTNEFFNYRELKYALKWNERENREFAVKQTLPASIYVNVDQLDEFRRHRKVCWRLEIFFDRKLIFVFFFSWIISPKSISLMSKRRPKTQNRLSFSCMEQRTLTMWSNYLFIIVIMRPVIKVLSPSTSIIRNYFLSRPKSIVTMRWMCEWPVQIIMKIVNGLKYNTT